MLKEMLKNGVEILLEAKLDEEIGIKKNELSIFHDNSID
jgi:hypothetical protein